MPGGERAALNKGVTKLSEKKKEKKEKKKKKGKEKKTETFPDRTELNKRKEWKRGGGGGKQAGREERENETGWKAEMKWGEAWLVRGVPPRHSLLINQPPTTPFTVKLSFSCGTPAPFLSSFLPPPSPPPPSRLHSCFSVSRLPCRYPTRMNSIIGYFNQGNRLTSATGHG